MNRKSIPNLIGFILFILGILSMLLKVIGMQFIFMGWVQSLFGWWSIVVYLIMTLGGFMMIVLSNDNTRIPKELN